MKTTFKLKAVLFLVMACMFSTIAIAQTKAPEKKKKPLSPRDSVSRQVGTATITINYGSPRIRNRKIWGGLVPYDTVWRTGANEATRFSTDKDIMIAGKKLPAGTYGFFAIPTATTWTIIFNSVADQWGAFKYDASKDVLRAVVTPVVTSKHEKLVYRINYKGACLDWAHLMVPIPITPVANN